MGCVCRLDSISEAVTGAVISTIHSCDSKLKTRDSETWTTCSLSCASRLSHRPG